MTKFLAATPQSAPSVYGLQEDIYAPTTSQVIKSSVNQVFEGVGSYKADVAASGVANAKFKGTAISREDYSNSEFYRPGVGYFTGMTDEQAKKLAEFHDAQAFDNEVLQRSTTGQAAVGVAASLVAGIFEPKNMAAGVATMGTGAVLASGVKAETRMARILNARRMNSGYAARAQLGAAEGLVAAAAIEPSNRYSADILQQDYGMADSAFNIATSVIFGAGLEVAPKFIKERFSRGNPNRNMDITMRELDTAVEQLATGKRVDVAAVEKSFPEQSVEAIKALEAKLQQSILPSEEAVTLPQDAIATTSSPQQPLAWQEGLSPKTMRDLESPASWVVREKETGKTVMETYNQDVVDKLNTAKYEAVPITEHLANLNGQTHVKGGEARANVVRQAALGNETLESLSAGLKAERATTLQNHVQSQLDPANDTAIDVNEIARLDDFNEQLKLQEHIDELQKLDGYMEDIAAMKKQGILNEADEKAMLEAFDSIDENQLQSAWETARICLTRG